MFSELKRLGKETAVYGLSTVVARLLNFLLVPLYTYCLPPAEYGVVATVFSYLAFLNVVYGYALDFAYMRHARAGEEGRPEAPFSTAFYSLLASSLALSVLMHLAAQPLSRAAGIPEGLSDVTRYAAWILALDALSSLPFAHLRMEHRAGAYAGVKVANIVMNLALNYAFVYHLRLGIRGVFLASLVTSCATFVMLAPVVLTQLEAVFDRGLYRELLRFSLPLVPGGLASMAVQVIDRPILKHLTDDATVGVYQANYRLGIFMMMAVNMFDAAWRPFFLQRAADDQGRRLLARVLTYFVAAAGLLLLLIGLFIPHIVSLPLMAGRPLINPAYWGGLPIVPVVTMGYLFNGIYVNLLAPATLAKRSELVAYATGIGAAVNVATNLLWIPRWGMMGAAAATLAAYAAMAGSLYLMGRRVYPVPYEGGRLLRVALCLCAVAWAARAMGLGFSPDRVAQRLSLLLAFPLLLAASGFLDEAELSALKGPWRGGSARQGR